MRVQYLSLYKWENLADGSQDKFKCRLDSLPWELSLRTKFGCPDITIPAYLPECMYDDKMKKRYQDAKIEYALRGRSINKLVDLLKDNIKYDKKIDNEYLYELWISRIFELDFEDDPLTDIEILSKELLENNEVNPFDIDLVEKRKTLNKSTGISKIFCKLKKLKKHNY